MKIVLFTLEYPPFKGGVAQYYANVINNWPEPDNITVITNESDQLINPHRRWGWLRTLKKLNGIYQSADHLFIGHILPQGTAAWLFSLIKPVKYSIFLHGLDFSLAVRNWRKKILTRLILKKAVHIFCSNSYLADQVKRQFISDKKKILIINPGVAPISFNDQEELNRLKSVFGLNDKFILLGLGRLVERKGFDRVIQAVKQMSDEKLKLIIAGDGPDRNRLQKLAYNDPKIIFLGKISDKDKQAWLNVCDCLIMTSREIDGDYEGFGIVYLEANLAGKPVIAGRSGGVGDAVIDGVTGIMVNPGDTGEISGAIGKLLQYPELGRKLGQAGQARALADFNWKSKIKIIYDTLNK